jgi:D-3-phosphoglycerate dehydrogenase
MKVMVCDPIDETRLKELKEVCEVSVMDRGREGLLEAVADKDVIIVRSATTVTRETMDAARNLKVVIRAGVGLDNVDVDYAKQKGIKVLNTPKASTNSVAELAVALMLAVSRRVALSDRQIRMGRGKKLKGNELQGKSLGVIGLGRIGSRTAEICHDGFGMRILIYDPGVGDEQLRAFDGKAVELDEVMRNSDVITVHVPLTESTKGLVNGKRIQLMQDSAILINTARAGVVNDLALYSALKEGRIAGAGLDMFDENIPFDDLDNVVLTAHMGAATYEAQGRVGAEVVSLVKSLIKEEGE